VLNFDSFLKTICTSFFHTKVSRHLSIAGNFTAQFVISLRDLLSAASLTIRCLNFNYHMIVAVAASLTIRCLNFNYHMIVAVAASLTIRCLNFNYHMIVAVAASLTIRC
jgi:predicted anti-sigma-YlaC factor YlaD